MSEAGLRIAAASLRDGAAAVVDAVRPWRPDIVVVRDGPWRVRWRTPLASLANALGLFYAGGGGPSAGNAVLVSLRVQVGEIVPVRFPVVPGHPLRAAVLVHCTLGSTRFVVVGVRLADDPAERESQGTILTKTLADVAEPLILAGYFDDRPDGPTARRLTTGRIDAATTGASQAMILAGAGIQVRGFHAGSAPDAPIAADITLGAPTS